MLKVVKIGGNVVDNPEKLDAFLRDFALLDGPKILVHGGGKIATSIGRALGIEARMIEGRRVTDAETLKVVTMVYAGLVNKTIVDKLRTAGCRPFGPVRRRRGADPVAAAPVRSRSITVLSAIRCRPVRARCGPHADRRRLYAGRRADYGRCRRRRPAQYECRHGGANRSRRHVGRLRDGTGLLLREAGRAARRERRRQRDRRNHAGSLRRAPDRGIVADGMLPKLENAFRAIDSGVRSVAICSADRIASPGYGGTTLRK